MELLATFDLGPEMKKVKRGGIRIFSIVKLECPSGKGGRMSLENFVDGLLSKRGIPLSAKETTRLNAEV